MKRVLIALMVCTAILSACGSSKSSTTSPADGDATVPVPSWVPGGFKEVTDGTLEFAVPIAWTVRKAAASDPGCDTNLSNAVVLGNPSGASDCPAPTTNTATLGLRVWDVNTPDTTMVQTGASHSSSTVVNGKTISLYDASQAGGPNYPTITQLEATTPDGKKRMEIYGGLTDLRSQIISTIHIS